jgi:hypothetical protein
MIGGTIDWHHRDPGRCVEPRPSSGPAAAAVRRAGQHDLAASHDLEKQKNKNKKTIRADFGSNSLPPQLLERFGGLLSECYRAGLRNLGIGHTTNHYGIPVISAAACNSFPWVRHH